MKTMTFLASILVLTGCQSAINKAARNTTYSAYELIGVQKRELLKSRVEDTQEEQAEASESFEDALTRLKALSGFKGGDLEDQYESLRSSYDRAAAQAEDVRKSIRKVETVAGDLFEEWDKEIDQIQTSSIKVKSQQSLSRTRKRYLDLHSDLKTSEARMEPVLRKFNDQVLYLKHNLNAQAIGSLKGEAINIQKDIERLIAEMNRSMASAEQFTQTLP